MNRGSMRLAMARLSTLVALAVVLGATGCSNADDDSGDGTNGFGTPGGQTTANNPITGTTDLTGMQPMTPGTDTGMPGANPAAGGQQPGSMVGVPPASMGAAGAGGMPTGGDSMPAGTDTGTDMMMDMGAAGAAADDMMGTAGTGADEMMPAEREDLGEGDGKDVIAIGDSWMNLDNSVGIQESLLKASSRPYRVYGVPGTKLLDEVIPNQYEAAKREDPDIKTVVMTGGGNDILQDIGILIDCVSDWSAGGGAGDVCKMQVDMVAARLKTFWQEMADDGVEDVIIVGYSRGDGSYTNSIEYSQTVVGPLCENAPLHCHSIDSDEIIDRQLRDNIHPKDDGYDKLGQTIWQMMQDEGMRR